MRFSIIQEGVFPVQMNDGTEAEIGLRDLFLRAHEIKDLVGTTPIERYAVFRLLVAFAMDIYPAHSYRDRKALFQKGCFDMAVFDRYVSMCESNRSNCFDLFDPEHPFMQERFDKAADAKAEKLAAVVMVGLPSGNNHIFLDHRPESVVALSASEAFRAMMTLYLFCTAGAQEYPSGVNNTSPVYSICLGENLFETIVMNMVSEKEIAPIPYGEGMVPWRSGKSIVPKEKIINITMLEGFTWRPRRIMLTQDSDGLVRKVYRQQGSNFIGNDIWKDPHVSYLKNKNNEWISLKPRTGRELWRDLGTILSDSARKNVIPPLVIQQFYKITDNDSSFTRIREVGVVTNQAKYEEWVEDELSLPGIFFDNDDMAEILRNDILAVEDILGKFIWIIDKTFAGRKEKYTDALSEQSRSNYLRIMHEEVFGFSVPDLFMNKDDLSEEMFITHNKKFDMKIKEALLTTIREVINTSGSSSKMMMEQMSIQRYIMNEYYKLSKQREEKYG